MIVIFGAAEDVHALTVQSEIRQLGGEAIIVDLRYYQQNVAIQHLFENGRHSISFVLSEQGVDSIDVSGVWWRREFRPEINEEIEDTTQAFIRREIETVLYGWLYTMPNIINPVDKVNQANNKMLQLRTAEQAGLDIPATLVTTNSEAIERFRAHVGCIVSKPMTGHSRKMLKATLIGSDETIDLRRLQNCPSLFQEAILGGDDFRVTVIDDEVFAARIIRPKGFTDIDWRVDLNVVFESITLPGDIVSAIKRYMLLMGLRYGAFDFRTDSQGRYVFLECNEAGQYLFVEIHGDIPISHAVARALLYGPK